MRYKCDAGYKEIELEIQMEGFLGIFRNLDNLLFANDCLGLTQQVKGNLIRDLCYLYFFIVVTIFIMYFYDFLLLKLR